jgi:hypothetical protein
MINSARKKNNFLALTKTKKHLIGRKRLTPSSSFQTVIPRPKAILILVAATTVPKHHKDIEKLEKY